MGTKERVLEMIALIKKDHGEDVDMMKFGFGVFVDDRRAWNAQQILCSDVSKIQNVFATSKKCYKELLTYFERERIYPRQGHLVCNVIISLITSQCDDVWLGWFWLILVC